MLLIGVGVGDACRRLTGSRWLAVAAGLAVVLGGAALAALWHLGDLPLIAITAMTCAGWLLSCEVAERTGRHHAVPLAVFGFGVALLVLLSGWGSDVEGVVGRWTSWVGLGAAVTPDRVLMVVGVLLLQLSTANQLVRLVLSSVGAMKPAGEPQASDQLKGGRLLGPMERLLIVGLGLAGQLTMASAVVAAKSIIRFPEISAKREENGHVGIDDVTEYFLVGSFASWILAFGSLALVAASP